MKLTSKESNEIKSQGLYIADKCDSCGKPLNQTIRYTRPDRKGRVFCSAECCDLAGNGEGLPEATLPHSIAGSVVHELIAEKIYGSCESCGLPLRDGTKAMHIPDLPGLYHSVLCAEQEIYERGCNFCGGQLPSNSHRFCSDRCANAAHACQFGDGQRLLAWLRAHSPELVGGARCKEEERERKCACCGDPMNGKRRQAKYCSKTCQKRDERLRSQTGTGKPQRSQETATAPLCLQGVTDTQSAQIVLARG
jgi:endogenous inhibitor of DNA gyrase (YacG/DUF329 family)